MKFRRFSRSVIVHSLILLFLAALGDRSLFAAQSVTVAWNPNPEHYIVGYNVYRSSDPQIFSFPPVNGATPVGATLFNDNTVENNKVYYYSISAVASTGDESQRSKPVRAVIGSPTNQPPVVAAAANLTVKLPAAVLSATVTDDGLPNAQLTYQWTVVRGPAVSFRTPQAASTLVSFFSTGAYTFRITASDGQYSSSADIAVTVLDGIKTGFVKFAPRPGGQSSGLSLVDYQRDGKVVSEAVFQTGPPIQSGRIYAVLKESIKTGIAVANPNTQPVTINFYFSNEIGETVYSGQTSVPPSGKISVLLDDEPFGPPQPMDLTGVRTFTFSASAPIAMTAVQVLLASDVLETAIPIARLASVDARAILPHFVDGAGWQSELELVNPTDTLMTGTVQFFPRPSGRDADYVYVIQPRSATTIRTPNFGSEIITGWIQVNPDRDTSRPSATVILYERLGDVTLTMGTIYGDSASTTNLYVETSGIDAQGPGSIQTDLTIVNPGENAVQVDLTLLTTDWGFTPYRTTLSVPAGGKVTLPPNQIPGLTQINGPTKGIVQIQGGPILATALRRRYRDAANYALMPIPSIDNSGSFFSLESKYLYFAEGEGFTTQYVGVSLSGTTRLP